LIFCYSPTVIALASLDFALRTCAELRGAHRAFSSARDFVNCLFSEEERKSFGATEAEVEAKWQKVEYVKQKIEKGMREKDTTNSAAKQIFKKLSKFHDKMKEYRANLEDKRLQALKEIEPKGFWGENDDDYEAIPQLQLP